MENPYQPTRIDESHTIADRGIRDLIIVGVLAGLASYGAVTILQDTGVLVWRNGKQYFWFQDYLFQQSHTTPQKTTHNFRRL